MRQRFSALWLQIGNRDLTSVIVCISISQLNLIGCRRSIHFNSHSPNESYISSSVRIHENKTNKLKGIGSQGH